MKAERVDEGRSSQGIGLSGYEMALLKMVAEGSSPAEMAEAMATTRSAVLRQLSLIRLKLNVSTDVQAVALATERGWI